VGFLNQDRVRPRPAFEQSREQGDVAAGERPVDETGGPMARRFPLASRPECSTPTTCDCSFDTRHPPATGGHQALTRPAQGVETKSEGVAIGDGCAGNGEMLALASAAQPYTRTVSGTFHPPCPEWSVQISMKPGSTFKADQTWRSALQEKARQSPATSIKRFRLP